MERWNIRIAICVAILVFALTCIGLMYYVHMDYLQSRQEDRGIVEFKKKFQDNSREIECYKIFRETGYLPKFCGD
jgi:hypothetical protein